MTVHPERFDSVRLSLSKDERRSAQAVEGCCKYAQIIISSCIKLSFIVLTFCGSNVN